MAPLGYRMTIIIVGGSVVVGMVLYIAALVGRCSGGGTQRHQYDVMLHRRKEVLKRIYFDPKCVGSYGGESRQAMVDGTRRVHDS